MYPLFRRTVETIIKKHGNISLEEFYEADSKVIKVKKANFMDFTIEKAGNMLFVGYYREVAGDLISDPIFVFQLHEDKWHPIRLEQVLGRSEIGDIQEDGRYYYYPGRFKDVKSFAGTCNKEWRFYYL